MVAWEVLDAVYDCFAADDSLRFVSGSSRVLCAVMVKIMMKVMVMVDVVMMMRNRGLKSLRWCKRSSGIQA